MHFCRSLSLLGLAAVLCLHVLPAESHASCGDYLLGHHKYDSSPEEGKTPPCHGPRCSNHDPMPVPPTVVVELPEQSKAVLAQFCHPTPALQQWLEYRSSCKPHYLPLFIFRPPR